MIQRFPEKRTFQPTPGPVRHVGRNEPIAFDDLVYALKVRCGLTDPPPRTLPEQIRIVEPAFETEVA